MTGPIQREPHAVELRLRLGKRTRIDVRVAIGSGGLLAIGALVSSILLSSAVVVAAAKRSR